MDLKLLKKIRENISKYGIKREDNINLDECFKGDILISTQGAILEYLCPTEEWEYLDHKVKYISSEKEGVVMKGEGTRTNDGYVFQFNRMPESDHDISRIIKREDLEN